MVRSRLCEGCLDLLSTTHGGQRTIVQLDRGAWEESQQVLKFWFCFLLEAENQGEDTLASKSTRETRCFHEKAGLLKIDF